MAGCEVGIGVGAQAWSLCSFWRRVYLYCYRIRQPVSRSVLRYELNFQTITAAAVSCHMENIFSIFTVICYADFIFCLCQFGVVCDSSICVGTVVL